MKRYIVSSVLCISCVFLGMGIYRNNWFPKPQLKRLKNYYIPPQIPIPDLSMKTNLIDKILTSYSAGTPVFSDREYYDLIGDARLESSYLLQIPRHLTYSVEIEVNHPVKIYRFLTDTNDNSVFSNWDFTDIEVKIIGSTCTHTTVVSKIFDPGKITLASGGPIAASPVLIQDLSNIPERLLITILNKEYTNLLQ